MKKTFVLLTVIALILLVSPYRVLSGGQSGTTLIASKTATGFWEREITYDWTIDKAVNPTEIDICSGNTGSVYYIITLTKTQVGEVDVYGVRGTITVTNGGDEAIDNLKLVDRVEYKLSGPEWHTIASETMYPE